MRTIAICMNSAPRVIGAQLLLSWVTTNY